VKINTNTENVSKTNPNHNQESASSVSSTVSSSENVESIIVEVKERIKNISRRLSEVRSDPSASTSDSSLLDSITDASHILVEYAEATAELCMLESISARESRRSSVNQI
jgi:hypothetical protein